MEGVKRRGGAVAIPLEPGDVEVLQVVSEGPPKYVPANKGTSKYPFDQIPVGGGMRLKRNIDTAKSAIRGWVKRHKGQRYRVWRLADGFVMVKRIK